MALYVPPLNEKLSALLEDARVAPAVPLFARGPEHSLAALRSECPGVSDADLDLFLGVIAYSHGALQLAYERFAGAAARGDSPLYSLALGHAALATNRPREAIAAFRRALEIDSTLYEAHWWLWNAIGRVGETDNAVRGLKSALLARDEPTVGSNHERVHIPDTTLCIVDCVNHALAERALRSSVQACAFAAAKFISDKKIASADFESIVIDPLRSSAEYSRFVMKELLPYIDTDYVLLVQWDGWVATPSAWEPQFLLYDYIGARWIPERCPPGHDVGNGGFSLRSRELLEALQDKQIPPCHPEDYGICQYYRALLEERYRIAFAPGEVAERFSVEMTWQPQRPFGFHGVMNVARFVPDPSLLFVSYWDGYKPRVAQARITTA